MTRCITHSLYILVGLRAIPVLLIWLTAASQPGPAQGFLALLLVISSLITRSLALTSRRLERRVKELDSLQAVGRALSASLKLDAILAAIYTQVAARMPAQNFYVALYQAETNEVSFPLAIENARLYMRTAEQSVEEKGG